MERAHSAPPPQGDQLPRNNQPPPQKKRAPSPAPEKQRRCTMACDNCHRRGQRCIETPRGCTNCLSFSCPCTYTRPTRRRGKAPQTHPDGTRVHQSAASSSRRPLQVVLAPEQRPLPAVPAYTQRPAPGPTTLTQYPAFSSNNPSPGSWTQQSSSLVDLSHTRHLQAAARARSAAYHVHNYSEPSPVSHYSPRQQWHLQQDYLERQSARSVPAGPGLGLGNHMPAAVPANGAPAETQSSGRSFFAVHPTHGPGRFYPDLHALTTPNITLSLPTPEESLHPTVENLGSPPMESATSLRSNVESSVSPPMESATSLRSKIESSASPTMGGIQSFGHSPMESLDSSPNKSAPNSGHSPIEESSEVSPTENSKNSDESFESLVHDY